MSKSYDAAPEVARAVRLLWPDGPEIVTEHRFHPVRRWRFDLAIPSHRIAIEVEGGIWTRGRHTRGSGYLADLEKYNEATALGWAVLRYDAETARRNPHHIIAQIKNTIKAQEKG